MKERERKALKSGIETDRDRNRNVQVDNANKTYDAEEKCTQQHRPTRGMEEKNNKLVSFSSSNLVNAFALHDEIIRTEFYESNKVKSFLFLRSANHHDLLFVNRRKIFSVEFDCNVRLRNGKTTNRKMKVNFFSTEKK